MASLKNKGEAKIGDNNLKSWKDLMSRFQKGIKMSLSKQLYLIISMIFLLIFTGNFIISVKIQKSIWKQSRLQKAQDMATSLGMSLKSLLKDKTNPEIESIINAIGNSGFIKRLG